MHVIMSVLGEEVDTWKLKRGKVQTTTKSKYIYINVYRRYIAVSQ